MSQLNTDRFSNFSCRFLNPNNFFQFQLWLFWYIISKLVRYHQQQDKKVFCYQKLVWPFTAWINCSSDFKKFANSLPSALNFKSFPPSLQHFFSQQARTILVTKYQSWKRKSFFTNYLKLNQSFSRQTDHGVPWRPL